MGYENCEYISDLYKLHLRDRIKNKQRREYIWFIYPEHANRYFV